MTPRRFRLIRVADLRTAHRTLAALVASLSPHHAGDTFIVVPSATAGRELRRTVESILLIDGWTPPASLIELLEAPPRQLRALAWPAIGSRGDLYESMHRRLTASLPLLSSAEREIVMLEAAVQAADAGTPAPFPLRPGLVAEMVALYDAIHCLQRSVGDFERSLVGDLEPGAGIDRGAVRLLEQTRFLVNVYRVYEKRLSQSDRWDEHRLRAQALDRAATPALKQVVVCVADSHAEAEGLWPADFDLLTRLPSLSRVDVVATDEMLEHGGWRERLETLLPGIEECRVKEMEAPPPVLQIPAGGGAPAFVWRDREDEVASVIRRVGQPANAARGHEEPALDRIALVYQRPLPYLYVARQLLDSARLPFDATDALPLASEPSAAALDLLLEFITAEGAPAALLALVGSPHFVLGAEPWPPSSVETTALAALMHGVGYTGGRDRLATLVDWAMAQPDGSAAARARRLLGVGQEALQYLAGLDNVAPMAGHIDLLLEFLDRFEAPRVAIDLTVELRRRRASNAVRVALSALRDADRAHGGEAVAFAVTAAWIRRALETRTFTPRVGADGLRLIDARAALFGDFDDLHVLGLVESEWPQPSTPNVFFPASLLRSMGWPTHATRLAASRARFRDLLRLPRRRTWLSSFTLEDDALVSPSVFIEEADQSGLAMVPVPHDDASMVFIDDALAARQSTVPGLDPVAERWVALRARRTGPDAPVFHGETGPYERASHSVTAVEMYLDCPFRYFAGRVLRLEDERPDAPTLDPLLRGRFVHAVFERFFTSWGRAAIDPAHLAEARRRFVAIVDELLTLLPEADRPLERARMVGHPGEPGTVERVLRLEAERGVAVVERLLELSLEGRYLLQGVDRALELGIRGIADRVDILEDGSLRLLDYKSGLAPNPKRAIQIPIYALCAERQLAAQRGATFQVGEAGYVALGEPRAWVPVIASPADHDKVIADGQQRTVDAVERITAGSFPPRPAELRLCATCAWSAVCRKDYVGEP